MVRRVAFKKAIFAGVAGAVAWEVAVRIGVFMDLPLFDLVRELGMLILGAHARCWEWWPAGMAMHAVVGAIWAVFYAYFFWSLHQMRPVLQGMVFSLLPAVLAGLIMVPQMDLMLDAEAPMMLGVFARGLGWYGPLTIVAGHLIYGAVMGSVYVRPVGYAVGRYKVTYG